MQGCGMPWPGDEGEQRWEQAWMAIKKVSPPPGIANTTIDHGQCLAICRWH